MSDIKVGDRVRVVMEGEVRGGTAESFEIGRDWANWIEASAEHIVSVEKIEPPVTAFKPGDFVKSKDGVACLYYLTQNGYVMVSHPLVPGGSWEHYEYDHDKEPFDSTEYTKVEMVEKPF